MGFLPSIAKATTVQNESKITQPTQTSDQYLAFANAAGNNALGGQGLFTGNLAAQQNLAQQYQGIANGTGPNPAQAALQQATGQNVAAQNALMAGQRGASANSGLIARQGAMQGANVQQQAVGQGALMQAQQQQAALQGMGGLYGQMGNQIAQNQGANVNLLNVGANANAAQNDQNIAVQNSNAGIEQANAGTAQGALSGFASGSGAAMSSLASGSGESKKKAKGGLIELAEGGEIEPGMGGAAAIGADAGMETAMAPEAGGPQSFVGQLLGADAGMQAAAAPQAKQAQPQAAAPPVTEALSSTATPALSSTAGTAEEGFFKKYGMSMMGMAKGGPIDGEQHAASLRPVPGKAEKAGDSLENDKVKALLSPGEIILPRSVTQSADPVKEAAKFVAAIMAKKAKKGKRK